MEFMKRKRGLLIGLLITFLVIFLLTSCQKSTQKVSKKSELVGKSKYFSSRKVTPKKKRGKITFKVGIDSFEGAKKVRLWLPYPVSNEYQNITDIKIEGNFTSSGVYRESKFGNTILYAEWKEPKSRPELAFSFKIERSEIIRKNFPKSRYSSISPEIISPEIKKFLLSSSHVPTTGKVKDLAEKATKGKKSILLKAEAIYDFLVEKYQRDPNVKGCGTGDVLTLVKTKAGKCVDIHSVFAALARSVGVPFREIFGIRMSSKKEDDITGSYHCRGEFYLPGYGWVPVDASDVLKLMLKKNLTLNDPEVKEARSYFFGSQTETYIDFGTGRDLVLNPPQDGEKLNYFMYPYAEVDGKPLDYLSQKELKYTVTFKEL